MVWINDAVEKFIVELGVDVGSFCHTGFGIHRTETAEAVIEALEAHRRQWGVPLGVVFDHGTANLSDDVAQYLKERWNRTRCRQVRATQREMAPMKAPSA